MAPNFTLTDQFGHPFSLDQYRGREVIWTLIDSRCTDTCPLAAQVLRSVTNELGAQAARVQILAINANPGAPKVSDVYAWSAQHHMLDRWRFGTATPTYLDSLYRAYHVAVVMDHGKLIHDSATILIDPSGHERLFFETSPNKDRSSLAAETSALLGGVRSLMPH
ncbi:MAG: SCO family protein [Acidimicrobiales bacterium]